jgi:hypothetical protein
LFVEEILVEQRPNRAEVNHVASQRIIDRHARKDIDLGMVPACHHLKLTRLGDLSGEPDAAGTHDAAVLVEEDRVGHIFLGVDCPFFDEPVVRLAVLVAVILKAAHPGLVADRAVERMIDQEILHDHPLMLFDLGAIRDQDRPVLGRGLAARDELGDHLDLAGLRVLRSDLDLAHPAVGDDRKRRVPAVIRNVDTGQLRRLDGVELLPLGEGVFLAVDDDRRHRGSFSGSLAKFKREATARRPTDWGRSGAACWSETPRRPRRSPAGAASRATSSTGAT